VAEIDTVPPEHIDGELAVSVIFGTGFTGMVTVPARGETQPTELEPTTEYVVVMVGQTVGPRT
jgi:hypothetical protein